MTAPLPDCYTVRHPTLDDAGTVANMVNYSSMSDMGVAVVSGEQIRGLWQLPIHHIDRDNWLVHSADGVLAGVGAVIALEPYTDLQTLGVVHPEHEGHGLGAWLLEQMEERAAEYRALAPDDATVLLRTQTWSGNERSAALLTAHGYRLERVFRVMQIDLEPEMALPDATPPAGITIRTFVRGQDEPLAWLASEESFQDHWNHHETPLDVWVNLIIETQESFDPTLWWLALEGEDVAGVAICDPGAPGEPEYGWVATLGVRRPWRGRGIARALLTTAFAEYQRRGKVGVRLGVDSKSITGAYRLYERAGMHAVSDGITYVKVMGDS